MKEPFDIDTVLARIERAVEPFPRAALFQLRDEGHTTLFEQLLACIISIRTRDEATVPIARRLFARARTPAAVAALTPAEIDTLIHDSSFHERKAGQIHAIAVAARDEYGGELPCDPETLLSFSGVGVKCANLALGLACEPVGVSVDVHVHRVTNRWGYVATNTPEQTTRALEEKLPRRHWLRINGLLVPFGKHVCTGRLPRCSTCPVLGMCPQVGVDRHR
ncbi:MAG TPA: endonuclease III [Anaerolineae bacterium]|nr:endonuclease III [Anaerolineae bacterium]